MTPVDFTLINPKMRGIVRLLRAIGLETTDSGDGHTNAAAGMEGTLPVAHVHSTLPEGVEVARFARDVADCLRAAGLPVVGGTVQVLFDPIDGLFILSVYGLDDKMLT